MSFWISKVELKKIIFRVDASLNIGTGHVMRCMNLATELQKSGCEIIFISRSLEGNLNSLISKNNFKVIGLPKFKTKKSSKYFDSGNDCKNLLGVSQEQDAEDTIKVIDSKLTNWLIVDNYSIDETWGKLLRPYVQNIMVIDDLANRQHDCDLILDQNWFKNKERRYDDLIPKGSTKLLGPEYALLRSEFVKAKKSIKIRSKEIKRVFIFFGGSDPLNLTSMTLKALSGSELAFLEVDIVIGSTNQNQKELKKLVALRTLTHLHIQVDNISEIMLKADFAIGAGGVNFWEQICLGIPSCVISFAENQRIVLKDL